MRVSFTCRLEFTTELPVSSHVLLRLDTTFAHRARMNFIPTIALYLFSYFTISAAFPSSDFQARGFSDPRSSAAIDYCNHRPTSWFGKAPLYARGSLCTKPKLMDSPSQSPQLARVTLICQNKIPQCTSSQAPFCEKHCQCSKYGVLTCEKDLPHFPIDWRPRHKHDREALCNKACRCEMVEPLPEADFRTRKNS